MRPEGATRRAIVSRRTSWLCAVVGTTVLLSASSSWGDEAACAVQITRSNVVRCVLSASLAVRREREGRAVLDARMRAASPLLPSNPIVAFSAGQPTANALGAGTQESVAWDLSVSQELEIGGQRGTRRAAVDAELAAQGHRTMQTEREVATAALFAYFDVLAAAEDAQLSARLLAVTDGVAKVALAKAGAGLIAPIDGDVAEAETARMMQAKLASERGVAAARLRLASLLGLESPEAGWQVAGDLTPLPPVASLAGPPGSRAVDARPEVQVAQQEQRASSLRADVYRRARIPNPTISVFTQNYERAIGVGISFPIPLPDPVGRTNAGEIDEAEALAQQAGTQADELRRQARLELAVAIQAYRSRTMELAAFPPERVKRAEDGLKDLADEVQSGRLAVRDAVVAEQALIEFLKDYVDARHALCVASVELAKAAGLPLERGF